MNKYFKRGLSTRKTMKYVGVINKTRKFLTILAVFGMIWSYVPWKQIQAEVLEEDNATFITESQATQTESGRTEKHLTVNDVSSMLMGEDTLNEVIELRTGNTKTFIKHDGTYEVSSYKGNVHFLNSSNFYEEINNSLKENLNDIENTHNKFKIKMPKSLTKSKKIKYRIDDYEIEWKVNDINKSNATYSHILQEKQNYNDVLYTKQTVLYSNVFEGVDLEYVLDGTDVKRILF